MNRDTIKIYAEDGKEFVGTNYEELLKKRDAYEEMKRQEEHERQERLRKLEEEKRAKQESKEKAMKWITDCVDLVNQAIEKYREDTGELPDIEFVNENGKLAIRNVTPFILPVSKDIDVHSNWWNDLYKTLRLF